MAPGAHLGLRLVVRDVFMARHARRTIGTHPRLVDPVADAAFGVTFADGHVGKPMQAWQPLNFVTPRAAGARRDRAAVRFVAGGAVAVAFRAALQLFVVTAAARQHAGRVVCRSLVAAVTTRVPQVLPGEAYLRNVTPPTQGSIGQVTQVEPMRLVASRALDAARVEGPLRARFLVTLRALQRDL